MAIEDFLFPAQSLTTKAASKGVLGLGPMGMGDGMGSQQMLLGLLAPQILGALGMGGGQDQTASQEQRLEDMTPQKFLTGSGAGQMTGNQPANQFSQQTPGAPNQPGRIDQSSFGGQQQGQPDFMQLLSANIAKRFGGV